MSWASKARTWSTTTSSAIRTGAVGAKTTRSGPSTSSAPSRSSPRWPRCVTVAPSTAPFPSTRGGHNAHNCFVTTPAPSRWRPAPITCPVPRISSRPVWVRPTASAAPTTSPSSPTRPGPPGTVWLTSSGRARCGMGSRRRWCRRPGPRPMVSRTTPERWCFAACCSIFPQPLGSTPSPRPRRSPSRTWRRPRRGPGSRWAPAIASCFAPGS